MSPIRVLVSGAGGPAGIALIRAFLADETVEVVAADMDPYAAGLYLVDQDRRWLLPPGDADGFIADALGLCRSERINVFFPTVDAELLPLARNRSAFAEADITLALTGERVLETSLDRLKLARRCTGLVRTPRTEPLGPDLDPGSWTYPVVVKPRRRSGSAGVVVVSSPAELAAVTSQKAAIGGRDDGLMVQAHLPGDEYSIDIVVDLDGHVVSVVPRSRLRVVSGVSMAGRTLHDPELDDLGRGVVAALGVTLVAGIHCRRDTDGRAALLGVHPRFPAGTPLTVHSGVDLPRLCLDAVLGRALPAAVEHRDTTMVRFLDERFLDPADIVGATMNARIHA